MYSTKYLGTIVAVGLLIVGLIIGAFFLLEGLANQKDVHTDGSTLSTGKSGWTELIIGNEKETQDNIDFSFDMKDLGSLIPYDPAAPQFSGINTQGKYMTLRLILNNLNFNETQAVFNNVSLIDQDGRNYKPIGYHWSGLERTSYLFEQSLILKPNIPLGSGFLFEVSKDSDSFAVKINYKIQ